MPRYRFLQPGNSAALHARLDEGRLLGRSLAELRTAVTEEVKNLHHVIVSLLEHLNETTCIWTLPDDVLETVFQAMSDECTEDDPMQIVTLTHVCSRWRTLALSRSSLWSTISRKSLRWNETIIQRNPVSPFRVIWEAENDASLDIRLHASVRTLKELLPDISHRVSSLRLRLPVHLLGRELWGMLKANPRVSLKRVIMRALVITYRLETHFIVSFEDTLNLGPNSMLEHLELYDISLPMTFFRSSCASLKVLYLRYSPQIPVDGTDRLTPQALSSLFMTMPLLEEVTLVRALVEENRISQTEPGGEPCIAASLPCLRSLRVVLDKISTAIAFTKCLDLPSNCVVEYSCSGDSAPHETDPFGPLSRVLLALVLGEHAADCIVLRSQLDRRGPPAIQIKTRPYHNDPKLLGFTILAFREIRQECWLGVISSLAAMPNLAHLDALSLVRVHEEVAPSLLDAVESFRSINLFIVDGEASVHTLTRALELEVQNSQHRDRLLPAVKFIIQTPGSGSPSRLLAAIRNHPACRDQLPSNLRLIEAKDGRYAYAE